jgi:hypothetical protein
MKKVWLPLIAFLVLAGITLNGCSSNGYIIGTGQVVEKTYDYQDFTSLEISNAFQYDVRQSSTCSISITTRENIIPHLDIYKSGKTLIVRLKPGSFTNTDLKTAITLPELHNLSVSGASKGTVKGFKANPDLDLKVSGASQLEMDLETGPAQIDVSGASKVTGALKAQDTRLTVSGASRCQLTGTSGAANLDVSGASNVDCPNFQMLSADISVSGASRAIIHTDGTLSVDVTGASSLSYLGNPVLDKVNVTGASKINRQ